jgi:Rod binding domain-containing protein
MSEILPIAAVPADVRRDGADAVATYRAALGFEQVLLRRLTDGLSVSVQADGDEESSAATGAFADLLPDALAAQLASTGGLGLASDLYRSLRTAESRTGEPS